MVGLKRGTVKLEEHKEEWKEMYREEVKNLKKVAGDILEGFEHVGSTAIKGIKAKPIIYIMATVQNMDNTENLIRKLEKNGYEHRPNDEVEGRIFLAKGPRENRTHHLSITETNSDFYSRMVKFRDRLNNKKELAEMYEQLKEELAKKHPEDRDSYTESKSEFIQKVVDEKI